jgi:hypothetical protein
MVCYCLWAIQMSIQYKSINMCIVAVLCLYLAAIFLFASINMCIVALHARHLVSVIAIPLSPSILSFFTE